MKQVAVRGQGARERQRLFSWRRGLIQLLLFGLAVRLLLPQLSTLENSLQVVGRMKLWAAGLALLAQVASYLGSGYLLSALVAIGGARLSIRAGTLITIASSTVGVLVGGQFGTTLCARRGVHLGDTPRSTTRA